MKPQVAAQEAGPSSRCGKRGLGPRRESQAPCPQGKLLAAQVGTSWGAVQHQGLPCLPLSPSHGQPVSPRVRLALPASCHIPPQLCLPGLPHKCVALSKHKPGPCLQSRARGSLGYSWVTIRPAAFACACQSPLVSSHRGASPHSLHHEVP